MRNLMLSEEKGNDYATNLVYRQNRASLESNGISPCQSPMEHNYARVLDLQLNARVKYGNLISRSIDQNDYRKIVNQYSTGEKLHQNSPMTCGVNTFTKRLMMPQTTVARSLSINAGSSMPTRAQTSNQTSRMKITGRLTSSNGKTAVQTINNSTQQAPRIASLGRHNQQHKLTQSRALKTASGRRYSRGGTASTTGATAPSPGPHNFY